MTEEVQDLTPEEARGRILDYRRRIADGEEITDEELTQALLLLRAQRRGAVASSAKKAAAKKPKVELPKSADGRVDFGVLFAGVGKKKDD